MKSNARFKIGSCDWCLENPPGLGAFPIARQIGLDGLQISLGSRQNNMRLREKSFQKQVLEESKKQNIEIASLAIGELNNFPYKSDPDAEQWVSDSIDVCNAMNVHVVLLAFFSKGDLRSDPAGIQEVIRRLRRVAPKAEKQNVTLALESWLSAWEHMDILQKVGSPAVKVYYDLGNSHSQGYDITEEIRFLKNNIAEVHAKDYKFIFGQGKVNFPAVRSAFDDIGYSGWIHIEGATPIGLVPSYQADLSYLRHCFALGN